MAHVPAYLLIDANVLIDYNDSDISILTLASHHLGQIHVLSTVLDEVDGLDVAECERLGLKVIEPELIQLTEAAVKRGKLSEEDHLSLIVARAQSWTCVTNDRALRKACDDDGVPVLWGLQIMKELVRRDELGAEDAIAVAQAIHECNPNHIPVSLVERFAERVREAEAERRGS